jgi:signal transduction histidine kinase/ligand-binding sensor domain-containing protein
MWRTSDGVPNHDVVSLAQTSDGYIWVGTGGSTNSPVRFNGFEFLPIASLENQDGAGYTRLATGKTGKLWISKPAGAGSLFLRQDGKTTRIKATLPSQGDRGIPLYEDHLGNLWIGGYGLIVRSATGQLQDLSALVKNFGDIRQVTEDKIGNIWLATSNGLARYHQGKIDLPYPITNKLCSIYTSKNGSLWMGTDEDPHLIQITQSGGITYYGKNEGLTSRGIWAICEDLESNIWVGTYSGLYCLKGNRAYLVQGTDLQTAFIFSLLWDREGSLWAGTADGLYHLHRNQIEFYGASSGLGPVNCLAVGVSGIWASIFSRTVYLNQGENWTKPEELRNVSDDDMINIAETSKGDLWLATKFNCYLLPKGKALVAENIGVGPCFFNDRETLWIVNSTNVFSFRDGHLLTIGKGWPAMKVTSITTNLGQGLLIGTTQGLFKWNGELARWIAFGKELPGTRINSLEWEDNTLWLASDQTIARFQDRWQVIGADAGLAQAGGINSMLVGKNSLWIGGANGLFRANRTEVDQYLQGIIKQVSLVKYENAQGMPSGYVGPDPDYPGAGAVRGNDGRLWFASKNGVLAVNTEGLLITEPPSVVIESVLLDQEAATNLFGSPQETINVPAGTRNLEIHYDALTYVAPSSVVYKYRLRGLDPDWVNADNNRVARFSRLPPGNYEFQVRASNAEGVWNEVGASVRFTQEPFFYQTRGFVWLCCFLGLFAALLLTAVSAAAAHAISTRRIRRRLALLEAQQAMDRERARIARDIHDDVGSTLTEIVLLSELASREPAQTFQPDGHLAGIRSAARDITRRLDEIVWAVNPRNDTLDALVSYISKFIMDNTRTAGLRCHLDLPQTLPAWPISSTTRHNIFLACKEAVHNAIKHAGASQLQLQLIFDKESFLIQISDNGVGLPAPLPKPEGDGLLNLQERLATLGGICYFSSVPGQGTIVSFRVPRSERETPLSTK